MSQQMQRTRRKRFSLSVYISLILALTATFPMLATVASIEYLLKPALINQVSADIEKDAQTRIQLIDSYLAERLNDVQTLSESPLIQAVLNGAQDQTSLDSAYNMLSNVQHRDIANYISVSLLNTQGSVLSAQGSFLFSYPGKPLTHGKYIILPEALKQLQQSGKISISDVFYDPVSNAASVDFYARVTDDNLQLIGFVRASIGLHRLWEPVDSEPVTNGTGS